MSEISMSNIPSMTADVTHKPSRVRLHCALYGNFFLLVSRRDDGLQGFLGSLKVEPESGHTSEEWFHCRLELRRSDWKGFFEG
jgi:hypothetical protein